MRKVLLYSSITVLATACSPKLPEEFDAISLRFNDSSVAPEYHRSYTIDLNAQSTQVNIDSYGTVLVDTSFSTNKATYENIVQQLQELKDFGQLETCEDCSGASYTYFILSNKNKEVFEISWSHGKKTEAFEAILDKIKASVPNFGALLQTPLPEEPSSDE